MKKKVSQKKRTARRTTKPKKPARNKKVGEKAIKETAPRKSFPKTKKIERVPTYINNFDSLIQGGFKKNSTNLLAGGSGNGKSIFATQFLVEGMKKGEKALYVTFEERKEKFYKNMKGFDWDLEAYEKKGLFTFLEYTPIKVKNMLEEGGGTIEAVILKKKISRLVIDSITSFALLFDDELERREAALALFNMISKWNCTSLLTLEGNLSKGDINSQTLEFESDSIILLYFIRNEGQRERYLEVLKMRGTKHSKKIYQFHIDKKGIEIDKNPSKILKI